MRFSKVKLKSGTEFLYFAIFYFISLVKCEVVQDSVELDLLKGNLSTASFVKVNGTIKWTHIDLVKEEEINEAILNLDEYLTALSLKVDPVELKDSTKRDITSIPQYFESSSAVARTGAICTGCKILVGVLVLHIRKYNTSETAIREKLGYLCPLFRIATTPEVCYGLIERLVPTMYFILKNRPELHVPAFCGFVFQQFGCDTDDPYLEWNVELSDIPKRRPPILVNPDEEGEQVNKLTGNSGYSSFPVNSRPSSRRQIKILQLADLHIDPMYAYKSEAVCDNQVLCCRNTSKPHATKPSGSAGYFTDNRKCDPPMSLLELTLKHIVEKHPDLDLVYMTGDIVPHNVYSSTRKENTEVVVEASELLENYFPNTQVIVMVGNHEPHPVNFFSPQGVPENLNTRWLYDVTYESWKQWIPPSQRATYFTEGFYAIQKTPKFKILAVNTNVCYGFNFWGMYDVKDPGGQLAWMTQELDKAEQNRMSVHIVGHVPPGHHDCNKVWSRNFYNIVARYRSTIKAQFYGHTHYDELKLYFSPTERGQAISPLYISPSLTAYEINNPAYKIFYADPSTLDIIDYETYIFDLDKANETPEKEPEWFPLYRATVAYDIPDTRPENLGKFVSKMAANKTLFDVFNQYYHKALKIQDSTTFHQKSILCGIVRPYAKHREECDRIQEEVDGQIVEIPVKTAP